MLLSMLLATAVLTLVPVCAAAVACGLGGWGGSGFEMAASYRMGCCGICGGIGCACGDCAVPGIGGGGTPGGDCIGGIPGDSGILVGAACGGGAPCGGAPGGGC
jgi:hypothetical protein